MITEVKIAPISNWCEAALEEAPQEFKDRIGTCILIDTNSLKEHEDYLGNKYRSWRLVGADLAWLERIAMAGRLCEHVLELD